MNPEMRELYQQVIMDHNRSPRNFHRINGANHSADGQNPLCGDVITLDLRVDDGKVVEAGFVGNGCAISKASASMLTESVKGRPVEEVHALYENFHHLVTRDGPADEDALGKLRVFAGVGEFPARVKCASLAWRTLEAALSDSPEPVTTE